MVDERGVPAFLKIGCRALAFHIFKNLRLFDKKIVAGLLMPFLIFVVLRFGSAKIRNGQFLAKWGEMGNFWAKGGEIGNFLAKWA